MPHFFQRLPIKHKLTTVILGTTAVSLALVCAIFVAYEAMTFRQSLIARVTALADVLALSSSAALDFERADRAEEILGSAAAEGAISAAGLYTIEGDLLAGYSRAGGKAAIPAAPGADGFHFEGTHLFVFRPVMRDSDRIGTIGLNASMTELKTKLASIAVISSTVLAASLLFAFVLAAFLQRLISRPIVSLAATATQVSERNDYSLRAAEESDDELGRLAHSFNGMLAGIQERDKSLVATNDALNVQIAARMNAERGLRTLNEELEQRVKDRTTDLQRSNEELEQFAYVASHDLQEPLRMIVSYLQLLERRYGEKLDAEGRQFMDFAVDGGRRMQTLIQDLLAFSRVGTRTKPFQPVDLGHALAGALANLQVVIGETGATITHDTLPTVTGDATQLTLLLQNLISNAIKFRGKEPPKIHVSCERGAHEWHFGVRDNGIGIEPQYFDRIFVIFKRLHSREKYPGTGIGLAVCKKIVGRHGGQISVESEPGKGSAFSFTIADGDSAAI